MKNDPDIFDYAVDDGTDVETDKTILKIKKSSDRLDVDVMVKGIYKPIILIHAIRLLGENDWLIHSDYRDDYEVRTISDVKDPNLPSRLIGESKNIVNFVDNAYDYMANPAKDGLRISKHVYRSDGQTYAIPMAVNSPYHQHLAIHARYVVEDDNGRVAETTIGEDKIISLVLRKHKDLNIPKTNTWTDHDWLLWWMS